VDIQVGFGRVVFVHAVNLLCTCFLALSSSLSGLKPRAMSADMLAAELLNGDAVIGVRGENRRPERDGCQVERNRLGDEIACKEDGSPLSTARCSGKAISGV
jgi:hypothetical protein